MSVKEYINPNLLPYRDIRSQYSVHLLMDFNVPSTCHVLSRTYQSNNSSFQLQIHIKDTLLLCRSRINLIVENVHNGKRTRFYRMPLAKIYKHTKLSPYGYILTLYSVNIFMDFTIPITLPILS